MYIEWSPYNPTVVDSMVAICKRLDDLENRFSHPQKPLTPGVKDLVVANLETIGDTLVEAVESTLKRIHFLIEEIDGKETEKN